MAKRPPTDNRTALQKLVDASGLTLHEMSEVLGISVTTVNTRIRRNTRWKDQKEIEAFRRMLAKRLGREVTKLDMFPDEAPRMR